VVAEHHVMMWSVHGMNPRVPSDHAMIADRIRDSTMRAESVLHDLGAISIINSDSQGMGRIGEVMRRTWQLAHQMKMLRGDSPPHDNPRILQYLAKYTINPARAHGIDRWVGSLEPGKIADIVLWKPEFFGVKPELVIKGGYVAWGALGDGNASIPQSEPLLYAPHWGGHGLAAASLSANFVSAAAAAGDLQQRLHTRRRAIPVSGTRRVSKRHMLYNQTNPHIAINPRTAEIAIDGQPLPPLPLEDLPLNRRYFLL
jgi:urease subunit alpha